MTFDKIEEWNVYIPYLYILSPDTSALKSNL